MADINMGRSEALRAEMSNITSTQRAAVLMLLLGEEQAADIIKFLNPKEVQALGAAMVAAADFSQEAVNVVLDEFVEHLKKQSSLSMGSTDYVENVMRRALGDDKAASVLNRIMPGQASKGFPVEATRLRRQFSASADAQLFLRVYSSILPSFGDGSRAAGHSHASGGARLHARRCNKGRAKAAVLPVPVCAAPITSRPCSTTGMACAWIGVMRS